MGSSEPVSLEFQKPVHTVNRIYLKSVNVYGIVGTHDVLSLHFSDDLGSDSLDLGPSTITSGFSPMSRNQIPLNCNGAANVLYQPPSNDLLVVYRQLKNIKGVTLRVVDASDGSPVAYDRCQLSLGLETESFLN